MPTCNINNVTVHYQDRGRGVPIVLLHGFPLDSRIWDAQVEALSDCYRVIAPDLRGFGHSVSTEPFTVESLAEDVHSLLVRLGALPCVLGGLSMGGYVALAFVKKYASDLLGLALLDTRAEADSAAGKENRNRAIQLVRDKGARGIADEMFPKMLSPWTSEHRQDIARTLRGIMDAQPPLTIEHTLEAMRDREDYTQTLPSIAAPTLIVVGEHDAITPPDVAETMSKAIRNPTLKVIPKAGHLSPMEQPDDVTLAIRRFVEQMG